MRHIWDGTHHNKIYHLYNYYWCRKVLDLQNRFRMFQCDYNCRSHFQPNLNGFTFCKKTPKCLSFASVSKHSPQFQLQFQEGPNLAAHFPIVHYEQSCCNLTSYHNTELQYCSWPFSNMPCCLYISAMWALHSGKVRGQIWTFLKLKLEVR